MKIRFLRVFKGQFARPLANYYLKPSKNKTCSPTTGTILKPTLLNRDNNHGKKRYICPKYQFKTGYQLIPKFKRE